VNAAERLSRIWATIAQQSDGGSLTVRDVCLAATMTLGVEGAGATLTVSPMVHEIVHATDDVAAALEELQITLGEGPCIDAFAGAGPVLADDLDLDEYTGRWPAFTPAALARGARAVFALPLQLGAIRLGALDLYRTLPGPLTPDHVADALVYADVAGMLLLDAAAATGRDAAELAWQHNDRTDGHAVVHQATGMLLVQLAVDAETAYTRLRAHAYAAGQPLAQVAREIVGRQLRLESDPPPHRALPKDEGDRP
jgi:hypothetical protein